MSETPTNAGGRGAPRRPAPPRLDRLVRQAQLVLAVERLWPAAVLGGVCLAIFVALAWLGLWQWAPRPVRLIGLLALAGGLGTAVVLGVRAARVSRPLALGRLDRDAGSGHRPVSSLEDRLASPRQDPLTLALWELSRKRLDDALGRVRVAAPRPRMQDRDPYALRAAALLGLVAAAFVAGPHKDGLIGAAFDWRGASAATAGFRLDAWVDPPPYTGRPPVILVAGDGSALQSTTLSVPAHATVVVRASGEGQVDAVPSGGLKPAEPPKPARGSGAKPPPAPAGAGASERRFVLDSSGRLALSHDGAPLGTIVLTAIPDLPPTIVLVGAPRPTDRGGLTLSYKIDDDYGVTGAEVAFTEPRIDGRGAVRSLVPPPKIDLNLPPTPGGLGAGQTTGDLSDHPWAGAEVTAVLSTKDEGGNVGLSPPIRLTLPARPFVNPLARALVEQRRDLVLDPDHREGVATALDALRIDPDRFGTSKAVYLGLYTAGQRLAAARNDDDLIALADYLWQMALQIEDGGKSQTARDLQAAEQALRDALQRGASPDEIKRLTEALRQTMDKLLSELARNASPPQAGQPPDPNSRTVTPEQLQRMMDKMARMAQSGDRAEAQRMLDQLQAMLDNLRTARNGSQNQARREMNRGMSELDKMTRDQQELRDRTFKDGHAAPPPNDGQAPLDDGDDGDGVPQAGAPPNGDGAPSAEAQNGQDFRGQQQSLRDRLDDLQRRMRQLGMKGEKGLEDAEKAMKEAEDALGQGRGGNRRAVDAQGRALEGLQQGANGLAAQMAQQGQGGEQDGQQGEGGSSISQGTPGQDGTDPLGRPRDGRGLDTRGREIGDSVAERAQQVLRELRQRLSDPNRPTEEMDYLQRLLQHY